MKYIINFTLIFFLVTNIFSNEIDSSENNKLVINKINIENLKYTSKKYFLDVLELKEGQIWDASKKDKIIQNMIILSRQISKYTIDENISEDGVELLFKVEEKLPFLVIPFFTYSNSSGLKPKILFRHYNLFGYGKYFGAKWEFLPTELMGILVEYQDPLLFNIKKLKLNLSTYLSTSYLNYLANTSNPIGVIEWTKGKRWSEKLEHNVRLSGNIDYTFQNNIYNSNNFSIEYRYIEKDNEDSTNKIRVPISIINPTIGTYFVFPIVNFFDLNLGTNLNYELNINNLKYQNYDGELNNIYKPNITIGQTFKIEKAFLTYNIKTNFDFNIEDNNYYKENIGNIEKNYFYNNLDLAISNRLNNSIKLAENLNQSVELSNTIYQTIFQYNDRYSNTDSFKDISYTTRIVTSLNYILSYDFFKRNNFTTKLKLFYNYNDFFTKTDYSNKSNTMTQAQVSKILYTTSSTYEIGVNPGEVEGYMGALLNLSLNIPLFTFTTPSLFILKMKKALEWEANFGFFIDGGLLQEYPNYDPKFNKYILKLGRDKLNLFPALATGIKLHIIPKFIPAKAIIEVGVDLYKIARTSSISGNYVLVFGIENQ